MNAVFTDTSDLLALLSPEDDNHGRATGAFATLRAPRAALVTSSFVLVET
jgi:predicted nucleic acid-binding protein